ncbi:MAG TPA: nuclear transport factor 2 family protein [Polyangia bacterium]
MRKVRLVLFVMLALPFVASFAALGAAHAAPAGAEKEVLAALETWRRAMVEKDAAGFEKVFHPDLVYGHSSGAIENKTQAIDHVVKSATVLKAVELSETKVKFHGKETAFVTGKVHYDKHPKDAPSFHQYLNVLSVFVKTPQGWQMIARQSTEPKPTPPIARAK